MEEKIYIVLSDSGTFPGRVIRFLTRFPYCHAMLAFSEECDALYSFGRKSLHNFLNGGFVIEQRDGAFFSYFSDTRCRVLSLSVTQEQYQSLKHELAQFCENAQEYKYDFFGICLRYFHLKKTFENRYTCSHFVAELLQRAQICTFPNGTMLVRPGDFLQIPNIRTVYEGQLSDIPKRHPVHTEEMPDKSQNFRVSETLTKEAVYV